MKRYLLISLLACAVAGSPLDAVLTQTAETMPSVRPPADDMNGALFKWCWALMEVASARRSEATEQPPYPLDGVDRVDIARRFGVSLETVVAFDTPEAQLGYAGWWRMPLAGSIGEFIVLVVERLSGGEVDVALVFSTRAGESFRRDRLAWNGEAYAHDEGGPHSWGWSLIRAEPGSGALLAMWGNTRLHDGLRISEGHPLCFVRAER